jgi:hypothetical protein
MDNAATRRSGPELRDQFIRERRALIFALEQKRECPIKIVACRCLSGCLRAHPEGSPASLISADKMSPLRRAR